MAKEEFGSKSRVHNTLFIKPPQLPDLQSLKKFKDVTIMELRGTNGSGKSTLPFMLQKMDPDAAVVGVKNKFTYLPNFRTIVAGVYPTGRAVGGLDTVSGAHKMEELLDFMLEFAECNRDKIDRILFEGIMTSTSNTRWSRYVTEVLGVPQYNCYVGWCNTPLEVCIQRIYGRTGTPFNEGGVRGKFEQLSRQFSIHENEFPQINRVEYDAMCSKEDMVTNWINFDYKPVSSIVISNTI